MLVHFNGGPWDGVEFEVPVWPDAIGFRHTQWWHDPVKGNPLAATMHAAKVNYHQYLYDKVAMREGVEPVLTDDGQLLEAAELLEIGDERLIVMHYRYAPTDGQWWEQPEE